VRIRTRKTRAGGRFGRCLHWLSITTKSRLRRSPPLRERARAFEILLGLVPAHFTLSQLQAAYDAVTGIASDKRNFSKAALASGVILKTGELTRGAHRPARLYRRA